MAKDPEPGDKSTRFRNTRPRFYVHVNPFYGFKKLLLQCVCAQCVMAWRMKIRLPNLKITQSAPNTFPAKVVVPRGRCTTIPERDVVQTAPETHEEQDSVTKILWSLMLRALLILRYTRLMKQQMRRTGQKYVLHFFAPSQNCVRCQ